MSDFLDNIADVRLNSDEHFEIVDDFTCFPNESLQTFLKCYSFDYDKKLQGNTYLVMDKESKEIIAFYTLKCNAIQTDDSETKQVTSTPAIEIARFAVNQHLQGQGWGTAILGTYILDKIKKVKDLVAVKCIILFAEDNDRVIKFYSKFGFKTAEDEIQNFIKEAYSDNCKLMYVSVEDIDKIINSS